MTTHTALSLAALLLASGALVAIRFYPLWHLRERGCDAYYFMQCAQALRERFRLPIILPPKYLAEPQEQWYPPFFPVLLSLLPPSWLHRRHWAVNHLIDLGVAAILFALVRHDLGLAGAVMAVIVYAIQFVLEQEYTTLTSRSLGMLLQVVAVLAGYAWIAEGSLLAGALAIAAVATLIYAHKLSLQLLWFLFPALSIVTGAWQWVAILGGGYVLAGIVWPSFFVKIQRAHVDIVRFWARNWQLLGAHPVRQSPIYGDGNTRTDYYGAGMGGAPLVFLKQVLLLNIFAVFLPLALIPGTVNSPFADFCWWWAVETYIWVAVTYFVPALRCLGLAQQYVKFSYVPTYVFVASYLHNSDSVWPWLLAGLCASVLLGWYGRNAWKLRALSAVPHVDQLADLLAFIRRMGAPRLMTFPYHLADEVAYRTDAQVVWGTHGYGFEQVQPFFPVLQVPVASVVDTFKVSHVVVDTSYVTPEELKLDSSHMLHRVGRFIVFDAYSTAQASQDRAGIT